MLLNQVNSASNFATAPSGHADHIGQDQGIIVIGGAPLALQDRGIIIVGGQPQPSASEPPSTTSSSLASFVPAGGLHPVGQTTHSTTGTDLGTLLRTLDAAEKDLEAQDRLGNFEIQSLMSSYNEAQTLASSVQKKSDDAANAVIQKI